MISIRCSGCNQSYRVPDEAAGRATKCRKCGNIINIPQGSNEPTTEFTAAAPAPAAVAFAQAPPVSTLRRSRRPKLAFVGIGAVAIVGLVFVAYVAATWFFGGASLGNAQRYLPDNCDAVGVANVEQFMKSKIYAEMEKNLPVSKNQFIDPKKVRRVVGGGSTEKETGVTIYETNATISADDLQASLKKSQPWVKEFKEEKVGSYTVYRYAEIGTSFRVAGQSAPKAELNEAFCLPESNVIVMGKFDVLKAVLERGKPAELSPELVAAMKEVDFSSTLAFAAVIKKVPPSKPNTIDLLQPARAYLEQVERVTGQINTSNGLDIHLTIRCKEAKKAEEFKDLAKGGLTSVKIMAGDKLSADAIKVIEAIKIENSGNVISADLKIDEDVLINAAKSSMQGGAAKR
ncbi:MAG: hypothetical protein AB7K24_09980 [Gemmataceae bacterium]